MTTIEIILYIALLLVCGLAVLSIKAAYQNGVTDGYGFAREPRNPGYKTAGDFLRKHMAHRWRELRPDASHVIIDEFHRFPEDQQ